jgi:peptide chain release factor 1
MIPAAKLERLLDRFSALESEMASGASGAAFVKLSREHAELGPVIETAREYRSAQTQLEETEALIADPATDGEMRGMAEQERADLRARIAVLDHDLKIQLLPRDAADASSAIVEIRAGTGGDEAALFAGDLLSMYQRYCGQQGWKTEVLSLSESELGGYKDATLEVEGRGVYAKLKFESGVHRVQRVPATETQGRIHTSAATVAVLPEAEDVDVDHPGQRPAHRHLSGPGRGRPARQQDRQRGAHHPSCPPIRWWRCRKKSPSTRTRPRR